MSKPRVASGQDRACIDCGALHWQGDRCIRCTRAKQIRVDPGKRVCACGGRKQADSRLCFDCRLVVRRREAAERAAALELEPVSDIPPECACGFGRMATPNHCACTRWKLSTDAVCEVCSEPTDGVAA